jgi:hypothetical protein
MAIVSKLKEKEWLKFSHTIAVYGEGLGTQQHN